MTNLSALPIGTILADDYRIESILGQGGFGITYLGIETMFGRKVAIKEFYPREFASRDSGRTVRPSGTQEDIDHFRWGLDAFEKEAKLLARFDDKNIVGVQRFFKANGTAYFVMDYCDGQPLDEIIRRDGSLSLEQLNALIFPLLNSLERIHQEDFLHRDIKPGNIFIRSDGSPILLDFGAARQENVSHSRSMTSLATDGYASIEQYDAKGRQGPSADIYGFAATLYRVVSDVKPVAASARILNDTLVPAVEIAAGKYPENLLKAIDAGMAVRPEARPQSIKEWRFMFEKSEPFFGGSPVGPKVSTGSGTTEGGQSSGRGQSLGGGKFSDKNKLPLILGAGALLAMLVLIGVWQSGSGSNSSVETAVKLPQTNITPISPPQLTSPESTYLKEIEGSWAERYNQCGVTTKDFIVNVNKSNEFVIRDDGKSYRRKISSVQKTNPYTYVIVSSPFSNVSESYEEHYQLASGTLRLMKRVVTPSNDAVKVFNGKNFQDSMNTPILVKCN
jgi:serine/threonine protein kinase